ncbi:MAG TPA: hypothetical protein GX706_00945 [Candidatus Moranbacteria bacterium]|nr:hypothetical protein [Candidatus Moranbacteria bacterium]
MWRPEVTNIGDDSYELKLSKYGKKIEYKRGDWRSEKELFKEMKRQGIEVPEDKRGREAYLKELGKDLERADKYGRDRIDGLPDVGSKDEEAPRKSSWF